MSGSLAITHHDSPPRPIASPARARALARPIVAAPAPIAFALLLLISAGLKSHPLLLSLRTSNWQRTTNLWPLTPDHWPLTTIALQLALALWLLTGLAPTSSRRAAILTLAIFCLANLYALLTHQSDCHCFGNLTVPPVITLTSDAALLTALLFHNPNQTPNPPFRHSSFVIRVSLALSFTLLIPSLALLASEKYSNREDKPVIYLNPDDWIGQKLPLLQYLDFPARAQLEHGSTTLILVDHNCDHCLEYLKSLANTSAAASRFPNTIIDLAPVPSDTLLPGGLRAMLLRRGSSYIAQIPVCVKISDGTVKEVSHP